MAFAVEPTAADYFGYGQPVGGGPAMPYGIGALPAIAPTITGSAAPPVAQSMSSGLSYAMFAPASSFWRSSGFGLFLLLLLIWYFDVRLLNR
jgi:hypothetical protein